ncbi:MAG: sulfotransferase [Nocardioidaceae bacterium]|nr:sulfotransferase [Nocardioidaceae bacterium]
MTESVARLKVLSIVGVGRSGTTVLASILGEIDGFASVGELRWLWVQGVAQQRPCGCGEPPSQCPVWSPVITQALSAAGKDQPPWNARQIIASQQELARKPNVQRVLRSANGGQEDWAPLQMMRAVTGAAVRAFADVTGARVVVDTSKRPQDAALFAALDGVEHYVLHIVRDPRAVVHSWRRAKSFSVAGEKRTMGTRRLPSTVWRWITNSVSAEILRSQLPQSRWLHMRYEDFAQRPRVAVDEILTLLGDLGDPPFTNAHTVMLHPNHIVAGNPSRFTTGSVEIRADEGWRDHMPRRDQWLVELATLPLMLRYRYANPRLFQESMPRRR